jgi:DNA invertase Pin-like site-specific DNA recombinase
MAPNSGKFVCYYRVSTARKGRRGFGLDAQRQAVKTYLDGGDWQIVGEFTEIESGRKSGRPASHRTRIRRAITDAARSRAPTPVISRPQARADL